MRNTLTALFEWDAVPVINENDTISVDEIKFGDNDRLAAMVTNLLQAPLLVILSVVDGLYRTDPGSGGLGEADPPGPAPRRRRARPGRHEPERPGDRRDAEQARGGPAGHPGGGIGRSSPRARRPSRLTRILAGEPVGTLFLARGSTQGARKRWIGLTARPRGHFVVDAGARRALEAGTKSLLAIGIVEVVGEFDKGDVVGIRDAEGLEFARGLTNYATAEARRIQGLRTEQARQALGAGPLRRGGPPRQPGPHPLTDLEPRPEARPESPRDRPVGLRAG